MKWLSRFSGFVAFLLLTLFLTALNTGPVIAADVCDKKPDLPKCDPVPDPPPGPDPGIDGSACAELESFFPAFAYVFTGELFLSNSEGDCSISIYKADGTMMGVPTNISYRLYDGEVAGVDEGRIVWNQRDPGDSSVMNVLLAEFQIEAGAILTPLPIIPRVVFQEPVGYGSIMDPDLHPDESKVIVSAFQVGEEEGWLWEFDIPELGSGPAPFEEVRELAYRDVRNNPDDMYGTLLQPLYGLSQANERVYFSYFTGLSFPLTHNLSYVEKIGDDVWSEPVLIAQRLGGYSGPGSVMEWDYGFGSKDVMAFTNTVDGVDLIEILDVEECVNNTEGCTVVEGIEGWDQASFTTFTEGQLPALLYLRREEARNVGYSIRECDLTAALLSPDSCYRTVINGIKNPKRTLYGVDSAD